MIPIAPDIWHLPGPTMRFPGGMRLPLASTVVRLPDRSLLLYSPVPIDDATDAALRAEGEVAHVVAPSLLHHLHAGTALERFPRAVLHAPAALAAKRPDLTIARELGTPDPAWGDAVDVVTVGGAPRLAETLLFHRPSGTLMCADFVFNLTQPANVMSKLVFAMMGVGGRKLAQSRMWKFGIKDRGAARASIDQVLRWPLRFVAPSHGEVAAIDTPAFAAKVSRAYGGRAQAQLASATSA